MFSIKDPYKLVAEAYEYKMTDELVKSYCYKDIKEVMAAQADLVDIVAQFNPKVVLMDGDKQSRGDY
jgi:hypothetical protein